NGEIVTLNATAFADSFRLWGGDINTTNNPATVTMTSNKTVFAYFGPLGIQWTNSSSGDWNVRSNWSPNVVPGSNDNVFITNTLTVTQNTAVDCGSLTLGSSGSQPTISGSGTLTLHSNSVWASGIMSGSGRTVISAGAILLATNPSTLFLNGRTLENDGTILSTGSAPWSLSSSIVTNAAG